MVIFLGHPYLSKAGHPVLRGLQGRACRPSRERGEVAGSRWEAFWAPEELTKWWLFLREITRLWFWGMVLGIPKLIWISKKTKTRDRFWVLVRSLFLLIIWGTFPEHTTIFVYWDYMIPRLIDTLPSIYLIYVEALGEIGSFCRLDVYFI